MAYVAIGAIVAGLVGVGVQTVRLSAAKQELAEERQEMSDERAERAAVSARAIADAKAEGERRVIVIQEKLNATKPALDAALAAARGQPDLDKRVRDAELAARSRSCGCDPSVACGSKASAEAAGVLAELQRKSQAAEAARTRYADEAGLAAELCAPSYDSLRTP